VGLGPELRYAGSMIEVRQTGVSDPLEFEVTINSGGSSTRHRVTMSKSDYQRLAHGHAADLCVRAAFLFLLDRGPKESILRAFDVSMIGRYFPDFEQRLPDYF
jgi:hypothetical protein